MRRTLLGLLPILAPVIACAQSSGPVWLRIRNDSQEHFEHVWQGWPQKGTDVDLGPLAPGQTSRWHAFPPVLAHYRKTRIQLAQRQLVDVTDKSFGPDRTALAPGRYTFAYRVQEGALHLRVIAEPEAPDQKH